VLSGETPRFSDYATDAGFLAASFIPFAGPGIKAGGQAARAGASAARPALETAETIAARRDAIDRLLNVRGPGALEEYLRRPLTAYQYTQNPALLQKFFAETSERIPRGTQMYRAPSSGQVKPRLGSQSVPLPRQVGADWFPNRIQSAGGSEDLQRIGGLLDGSVPGTGGSQTYAPGMVAIEAMDDLPGIYNLNEFLGRFNNPNWAKSDFGTESVLGPQVRYTVRDFIPPVNNLPPTWFLNAYPR